MSLARNDSPFVQQGITTEIRTTVKTKRTEMSLHLISLLLLAAPLVAQPYRDSNIPPRTLTGSLKADLFSLSAETSSSGDSSRVMTLRDYPDSRSTFEAALYSFAIPGAGQVYSNNYWEGLAFFGAEVGLWVVYAIYEGKGNRQTNDFQNFADEHWSVVRYVDWIGLNMGENTSGIITSTDLNLMPWDRVDWARLNAVESQIAQKTGNGFTHLLPRRPEQQYYELIGKYPQFLGGWDDAGSRGRNDVIAHNVSPNFSDYSRMRGKANDLYNIATTVSYVLVANHILSAVEAAWSTATNNANLKAEASIVPRRGNAGIVEFVPTASLQLTF